MNRLCLAADVPLVESGTTGFLGQVSFFKSKRSFIFIWNRSIHIICYIMLCVSVNALIICLFYCVCLSGATCFYLILTLENGKVMSMNNVAQVYYLKRITMALDAL